MVSEPSSLRPTPMESNMTNDELCCVVVGKSFKETRKSIGTLSDLENFITNHFDLPYIRISEGANGGLVIENLFDGIPNDVESQDHESFDAVRKLLCWISGSIELPECSKLVAAKVFDESPRAMEERSDQHIPDKFEVTSANSDQISSEKVPLYEIPTFDVTSDDDMLIDEGLNVDDVVKRDEEIVQPKFNDELILMKEFSNSVAHQLFDEMPSMMTGHEIKLNVPVLSRVASFGVVANQPNLLPSKFSPGKVNPHVQKLVVEICAFDSVAGAELCCFDLGGEQLWLIGMVHKCVRRFVSNYCLGQLTKQRGQDDYVKLLPVFNPRDKGFMLGELGKLGGLYLSRPEEFSEFLLVVVGVDMQFLLASSCYVYLVNVTPLIKKVAHLVKTLNALSEQGKMMGDHVRNLCFDPGGKAMLLAVDYCKSWFIRKKWSGMKELVISYILLTELKMDDYIGGFIFGAYNPPSWTAKGNTQNAEFVLKDEKISGLHMILVECLSTKVEVMVKADSLVEPVKADLRRLKSLPGASKNGEIVIFDPGIEEFMLGDLNLSRYEKFSKFLLHQFGKIIVEKEDALAFKLIFVNKAEFYLGNGDTSIESIITLEFYESRAGIPLVEISALKPKLLELIDQTHLSVAYSFEIIGNQLNPLALEFDRNEILQLIDSSVCKETKKSLQWNSCAAETDLKPLGKFNHYDAAAAGFLTDSDLKQLKITWSSTHLCVGILIFDPGGVFLLQIKVVGRIFIYFGQLNLILLAVSSPLNLSKYPLVKRMLILNVFVKRALISASYSRGLQSTY